jgi:STE24 endopeptidase
MPLLLLICMIVACLPVDWPRPRLGAVTGDDRTLAVWSAVLTGTVVAGLLIVARWFTLATVYRLTRDPGDRDGTLRTYSLRRVGFFFLNLGAFWFVLLWCGWGWTVRQTLVLPPTASPQAVDGIDTRFFPGGELAVLAPYLIALVGSWALFYDAERTLYLTGPAGGRREFWSRWGYVGYLLRHQLLLVFLPVFLVILQLSVLRTCPELLANTWAKGVAFVALFLIILLLPSALPLLLGLRPMPPGPVRDRLEAAAHRLGVRYRNLYVWDTRGNVATAMVAGLVPRLRHIVFTDLLLTTLPEDEIEAVFGHEVGHVRHGHLLYYAVFLLLSFLTLGAAYRVVELSAGLTWLSADVTAVLSVVLTGCYLFLVFGFVSRRCERQADVFGCKAVSCSDPACSAHRPDTRLVERGRGLCPTGVGTFARALERVEAINGSTRGPLTGSRRGPAGWPAEALRFVAVWLGTWQHGTIGGRVSFLRALDAAAERRFQWRLTALRWGLIVVLVAGIVGVAVWAEGGMHALLEGA